MKIPKSITIEPQFKIQTPHNTVVQSVITDNENNCYIEQLVQGNTLVYKKNKSFISNNVLTINENDLFKKVTNYASAHSQSIGVTWFPYTLPDGRFFMATGPQFNNNFALDISSMNLQKEIISDYTKLYYISGFDNLFTKLQNIYNQTLTHLSRIEFAVYSFGSDLSIILIDDAHNMYVVDYNLTLQDDFFGNLSQGSPNNDISHVDYKWSRFIPYHLFESLPGKNPHDENPDSLIDYNIISIQGFTFTNDELQNSTLYFSSQFAPNLKHNKIYDRFILVIPPTNSFDFDTKETTAMKANWTFLDLSNYSELDVAGYNTEFENIDYINRNNLLLTVAYHEGKTNETKFSKVYKISWND